VLLYFWLFHATRGEFEAARSYSEQCLEFAKKADDPLMRRAALTGLATTFIHLGNLHKASEILAEASRDLSTTQEVFDDDLYIVEPGSVAISQEALLAWFYGYPQKALSKLALARERALKFNHPQTTCLAQVYSAWVHQLRREPEETLVYANQAIALSDKHNLRQLRPWGEMLCAWARSELHQADEGIGVMRESLKQQKEMRSKIARTYFLVLLAEALRQDASAALEALDEAAREAESTKETFFEAEIHRVRGEILAAHFGHLDKAADCFRRAIGIANGQGAKSLELRSQVGWGNVVADRRGRFSVEAEQSHRALQEIYGSFSEGHDTKDLIDAKLLLEKLSSNPT
jgi:tetratricopeptide (TPR) repeat protein